MMSSQSSEPYIEVAQLSKSFKVGGTTQLVLDRLELKVDRGEFVGIVGKSGSGKSTLLNIIAGLESADSGEVKFAGSSISNLNTEQLAAFRLKNIGITFQFFHLLPNLSLLENILVPGYLIGASRTELLQTAKDLAAWVQIEHILHKLPAQVSGGELQRAAVARSLVNNPALLLADEPTGNLDSESGEHVMQLFHDSQRQFNTTILMVTHDLELSAKTNRTIVLSKDRT